MALLVCRQENENNSKIRVLQRDFYGYNTARNLGAIQGSSNSG